MHLPDSDHSRGLTAEQISAVVGISARAVRKRKGIDQFELGLDVGGVGRPTTLYDTRVLTLWGHEAPQPTKDVARRSRSDCGVPRSCTPEQWDAIVTRVKALFLANAQTNLKLAAEEATRQLQSEGTEVPLDVYKRLSRKALDHSGEYISEYRRENWEVLHQARWRKKDQAIAAPTLRYDYLQLFENAGWAGEGYGALRAWAIDVRKNDVWTKADGGFNHGKPHVMPSAIYIRDALTGYPLWMEPIGSSTESSDDIIRAYISCGIAWGTFPDICVALDNGRAMVSHRTKGVIANSLPENAWAIAAEHPALFGHAGNNSPILLNLPNVPQAPMKAALERSFLQMKNEFDATRSPHNYQGGTRTEATQLNLRSEIPIHLPTILEAGEYYRSLARWMWGDYVKRLRPDPKGPLRTFVDRGWEPSLSNAFAYYGGRPADRGEWPQGERLAKMLYHALEKPTVVKAQQGFADTVINGVYTRWMTPELSYRHAGRKVAVLPIPGDDRHAALLLVDDPHKPLYVGIAMNAVVNDMDHLAAAKLLRRNTQAAHRQEINAQLSSTEQGQWYTHDHTPILPATDDQIAGELHQSDTPVQPDIDHDSDDDDIDGLLSDADALLD